MITNNLKQITGLFELEEKGTEQNRTEWNEMKWNGMTTSGLMKSQ